MSEVRLVEVLGAAAFATTPGGVWDLLLSCPRDVEGAVLRTTPVEGGTLEEGAALAGAGSCRGVKVLFRRCCWRPCTSFSANIAS